MKLLEAAVGLAAFVSLFWWFRRLMATDRVIVVAMFLLGLLVVESVLYEPIDVPPGLFHIQAGGFQIRTIDLILLLAIVARVTTKHASRLTLTAGAWILFGVWLTFEAVAGVRYGNSKTYVLDEYKTLIYLGSAYAVSTARVDRPEDQRVVTRFVRICAVLAVVLFATSLAHIQIALGQPGLNGASFGAISSITSTLLPMVGILGLAIFLCSEPPRYDQLACALVLFATSVAAGQRASPLNLSAALVALVVVVPLCFRHLKVSPSQFCLGVFGVMFTLGSVWFARAALTGRTSIPFSAQVTTILNGREKVLSAQDRVNQLKVAKTLFEQHPLFGWGLGKTFQYYEVGFKAFTTTYLSHNIIADLLIRTGIVGCALFLVAFALTLSDSVKAWRQESLAPAEAAVALAVCAILTGWFAHGMVESLFEHVRLTPAAFIFVGLVRGVIRRNEASARVASVSGRRIAPAAVAIARNPVYSLGSDPRPRTSS